MSKDDVLTISLNNSHLVFTRYLYLKDEVKLSLLMAILNKSNDAIFWAYELFYSGFKHELFQFIWIIYYDFFATLNPSFELYLLKKQSEYLSKSFEERHISSLIQNLIIRPFNTDVFMMRKMCEIFETAVDVNAFSDLKNDLNGWILANDYKSIAYCILSESDKPMRNDEILEHVAQILNVQLPKLSNHNRIPVKPEIICLGKLMSLFSRHKKLIKGRNFYVKVEPEEVVQYETIEAIDGIKSYRILQTACVCSIDEQKWLQIFVKERNTNKNLNNNKSNRSNSKGNNKPIQDIYHEQWLYNAAFSPIWFDRIKAYKGYIDYEHFTVCFTDAELEEEFYLRYGYEPDEQPLFVKVRANIIEEVEVLDAGIREKSIKDFYIKYRNTGFIDIDEDELDALGAEPIKYAVACNS